ncbi:MAG: hypothetical protein ACYC25_14765 [Paludibacter sp.]
MIVRKGVSVNRDTFSSFTGFFLTFANQKKSIKPMRTKLLNRTSTIRFRRWSRVGYAIFSSLACNVSIGALSISVSDKTLQKADGKTMNELHFFTSKTDTQETDEVESEAILHQTQIAFLSEISFDNAAACDLTASYIINCNG